MPRRSIELLPLQTYHVYNRGNNKERLFFETKNYAYFLQCVGKNLTPDVAEISAFCLMPNHYHLLVQLVDSRFSERMKFLGISYAKAINAMYGRVGHVFEGRFKAKCVKSDEYLLNVSRYIHLNPLFGGLVQNAADWEYSSYSVYLPSSKRDSKQGIRIARSAILSHFSGCEEYMKFVESFGEEKMTEMEDSLW